MKTGLIIKPKKFIEYTIVPNTILRDQSLSLSAIGLYCFLISHSDTFEITLEYISNAFSNGKDAIRTRIKELEIKGYLIRVRVKDEAGKFVGWNYQIEATPNIRHRATPTSGKHRHRENPTQRNTNIYTNINTNTKTIKRNNNPPNSKKQFDDVVQKAFDHIVDLFPESYRPKNTSQKNQWLDCIDKLNRIDGYSPRKVYYIIQKARKDEFWQKNFYSLLKLRQTNKQGVKFIDIFFETFANELKGIDL